MQREPSTVGLIARISYDDNVAPSILARKLSAHADVAYAEPMPVQHIVGVPNDPLASDQYHLAKVHATQAWDLLSDSKKEVVIGMPVQLDWIERYGHPFPVFRKRAG